jgi:superkiller protein 3
MQLKRYPEAIASFSHALRIYPDYCSAWTNKGVSHCFIGEYDEAVTCLSRAGAVCPASPRILYWKGLALSRLGQYAEALDCLGEALANDPQNADAWVVMSNCHFMLGNLEESGHAFMVAYDIDKRDITELVAKGISLMRFGKKREALECMSGVFGILLR